MSKDLINWKEVSRRLSGNDNSIRSNKCPKKYEKKVNRLLKVIELWCSWINIDSESTLVCDECNKEVKMIVYTEVVPSCGCDDEN